jgi:hypothetical protein
MSDERYNSEEHCKRVGLRPVEPSPYPVHMPIPAPQQLGKLRLGWVRVVGSLPNRTQAEAPGLR